MDPNAGMIDQNAGTLDRIIRIVLGIALLGLFVVGPQTAWGLLGLLPLISGIFGFCPVYRLLGVNTFHHRKPPPATTAGHA